MKTCYYDNISDSSKFYFIKLSSMSFPPLKLTKKHQKSWELLEKETGSIMNASCSCMVGLGQCCNHNAALLLKVEDAVKRGYTSVTCTSIRPGCGYGKYHPSPEKL